MKSKLSLFLTMLFMNTTFAGMFYLWQWQGMEPAGRVFMFMIWFTGICGILAALLVDPTAEMHRDRYVIHKIISGAFTIAFAIGSLWADQILAATLYIIAAILIRGHQEKGARFAEAP